MGFKNGVLRVNILGGDEREQSLFCRMWFRWFRKIYNLLKEMRFSANLFKSLHGFYRDSKSKKKNNAQSVGIRICKLYHE